MLSFLALAFGLEDGPPAAILSILERGKSRSVFYTTDVPRLRELYPEQELFPLAERRVAGSARPPKLRGCMFSRWRRTSEA
jgi:hypothetical protein